ncbi:uncharacterized protein EV154DRAFT_478706 [Mucor mucedo]|uniref:uncharacterized protein n=1 Tax=Mucor mucedo TaxID=29922 RepID=UPI002220C282|nr:uncharacterized protein EV154DRAFT_478706 [Mucor mucedo]KAI7894191.1 hypothetical protein EV154DRAFT_478706 [Mucor mucedo]
MYSLSEMHLQIRVDVDTFKKSRDRSLSWYYGNLPETIISSDHRKILRERKIIADHFYISLDISGVVIQIAETEGQIKKVKLVDKGVYIAAKLGSLRPLELDKARTLCERLLTIKSTKRDVKDTISCVDYCKKKLSILLCFMTSAMLCLLKIIWLTMIFKADEAKGLGRERFVQIKEGGWRCAVLTYITQGFPSEGGKILSGFDKLTASMIKLKAHDVYMGHKYFDLDSISKATVSNGFNSILDLTDDRITRTRKNPYLLKHNGTSCMPCMTKGCTGNP